MRMRAAAASRNRDPILAVLRDVLPRTGDVLEVASGSGEHAVHFGRALPQLRFLPSDADPTARASIDAWRDAEGLPNVMPALALDATAPEWPVERVDAVLCFNMIHIAPFAAALGLLDGAARVLPAAGILVLYGPYTVDGQHTAESNEAFDSYLRDRDPSWGVRDLRDVQAQARSRGLALEKTVQMPANNLSVVFRREAAQRS